MCNLTLQSYVITLSEREPKARSDLGEMTARKQPNKVALVWINLKQTTRIIATLVMTHSRSCRRKDHQPHGLCRGCMHQVSYYALFLFASELLIYSRNVPGRIGIQVACMQSPFSSFFPSAFPSLPFLSSPPSAPSPPSFCTCMEPSHPPAWQAVAGALSKRCLVLENVITSVPGALSRAHRSEAHKANLSKEGRENVKERWQRYGQGQDRSRHQGNEPGRARECTLWPCFGLLGRSVRGVLETKLCS